MMYMILSALSWGLIIICAVNLYFSIEIAVRSRPDEDDARERQIKVLAWGVILFCISAFIGCSGYLLWDYKLITQGEFYKLQLLGRFFAMGCALVFFSTLSLGHSSKFRTLVMCSSVAVSCVVYIMRVFKW